MNTSPTAAELSRWSDEVAISSLLRSARTIAVYGLSTDPSKDSHRVAAYLQRAGYSIIPIHPKAREILGVACHASLATAPRADIVDCFRPSDELSAIVDEAIAAKAGAVWFQFGLMDADAARRAEAAGLTVIADRCAKVEHMRLIA
ncbi:MAG TPA: CoA-binding protein [Opitutaceae bacterium]|nr:CoA-binding protein [Opitutaceae bacterium]